MTQARSSKQASASRKNGSKSRGPVSSVGKKKVRLNALKDGLFTKDIVIEGVGERQEDFDQIKAAIWDELQPGSPLNEMLVADFVENWWRRQRIRRAEALELRSRLSTLTTRTFLQRSDEVDALKVKLVYGLQAYRAALLTGRISDRVQLVSQLEVTRQQLSSTQLGIGWLIDEISKIQELAERRGQLGPENPN